MTGTVQFDASPLYQAVLGSDWEEVSPSVRRAHQFNSAGRFDITHGFGAFARLLARCAALPSSGKAVPTRLRMIRRGHHEEWKRTFGTRFLRSLQFARGNRLLAERFGLLEIVFNLEVRAGGIHYRQHRSAICVGRWSLPLPKGFSPRVDATEMPGPTAYSTHVCVTVHLSLVGLLIRYEGQMESQEVLP